MIRIARSRALLAIAVAWASGLASANAATTPVTQPSSVDRSYCIYNRTKQHQVLVTAARGNATLAPGVHACCTPTNGLCTSPQSTSWLVEVSIDGKRRECAPGTDRNAAITLVRPGSYLLVREGRAPSRMAGDRARIDELPIEIDVMNSDARVVATIACRPVH